MQGGQTPLYIPTVHESFILNLQQFIFLNLNINIFVYSGLKNEAIKVSSVLLKNN